MMRSALLALYRRYPDLVERFAPRATLYWLAGLTEAEAHEIVRLITAYYRWEVGVKHTLDLSSPSWKADLASIEGRD